MKNIRILLFAGLFLFLNGSAMPQEGWNFGLSGGLNMSWISQPKVTGEPLQGDFGSRLSYNVGLFAEYGFNLRFFLLTGINYDQRGFTYKEGDKTNGTDASLKARYLEIPLLLRYNFLERETFDIYFLGGGSFAFLTGGKITGSNYENGVEGSIDNKITDSYNTRAFGIKLGLGAEIPFADNKGATFFDVRYNLGVGDVISQGGYYENSDIDATPQVLSFVVGVKGYIE
jgi:hypothetical protein